MKFFKNRLGIDVAYYKMRSINQIVAPRLSYATGAILKWLNGGTVENKGIEVMLTVPRSKPRILRGTSF